MRKKKIIICVTSDLATDQRVLKHCNAFITNGFDVVLVGRKLKKSLPMPVLSFQTHRFHLLFSSGVCFYLEYTLRLFFYLRFQRFDFLWANDLDTVIPCALCSKVRKSKWVFDSHEIFTEVPELQHTTLKKAIWLWVERKWAVRADLMLTVNASIAKRFEKLYQRKVYVVRNVPLQRDLLPPLNRTELGIPETHLILVTQGSGMNKGRGLTESIDAMKGLENVTLFVIGSGDAIPNAKAHVVNNGMGSTVRFIDRLPYLEMMRYTQMADVGLAYDAMNCLNFHFALPNKIFDYFQAGIAVISGPQPEIERLVMQYEVGISMDEVTPKHIVSAVEAFQKDPQFLAKCKENGKNASKIETWQNEQRNLHEVIALLT